MKFTYVLALILVLAVVAMAINPKKAAKKAARKAAKIEARKAKQAMKQCGDWTLSYSACEDNKMNITKTPSVSNENCEPKVHEVECVQTKTKKNNCVITIDRSACADMSQIETSNIVITKTGCGKKKVSKGPIEKPCKTGGYMGKRKMNKKNKGGKPKRKMQNRKNKNE